MSAVPDAATGRWLVKRDGVTVSLTPDEYDAWKRGRCVHCDAKVRPTELGDWIHVNGLYRCQSSAVAYGHLAHPADVPCRADGPNPCLGAKGDS